MTLDARVGERTRIARELHDTLLQSFHGLLLRFQTASYLLPERPGVAKEKLDGAIQHAAKAITEGRDAVQGLRASTVERNDLALAIRTLGDELVTHPSSGHRLPSVSPSKVRREICTRLCVTRSTRLPRKPCAMPSATRRPGGSRPTSATTTRNSDCACATMARDRCGRPRQSGARRTLRPARHAGTRGGDRRETGGVERAGAGTELELRLPASIVYATSPRRGWWSRLLGLKTPAQPPRRRVMTGSARFVFSPSTTIQSCAKGSPVSSGFSRI